MESLPISEEPVLLSLHFSPPTRQVTFAGTAGVQDIAGDSFGDDQGAGEPLTISAEQIKVSHLSKVSMSYDVAKVDD